MKKNENMIVHLVFPSWCWWWFPHNGEGHLSIWLSFHQFIQFRHPIPSLPKLHARVLYMHLLYPGPHPSQCFSNVMMHCNEHFAGPKSTSRQRNDGYQQQQKTDRKKGRKEKKVQGWALFRITGFLFPLSFPLISFPYHCFTSLLLHSTPCLKLALLANPTLFIVHVCLIVLHAVPYSLITLVFFLWRGRRAVRFWSRVWCN